MVVVGLVVDVVVAVDLVVDCVVVVLVLVVVVVVFLLFANLVIKFVSSFNASSSTVLNNVGLFIWTTVSDGLVETFASSKSPPNSSNDSKGISLSTRSLFSSLK